MKTIEHVQRTDIQMIDLTRSLTLPHGSLTPGCQPEPRWPAVRDLSAAERRAAIRAGDEFTERAVVIFAGFLLFFIATITAYCLA